MIEGKKVMSDEPKFRLTIQSTPNPVPPIARLRRVLKMLMSYGFRCTSHEELPPPAPPVENTMLDKTKIATEER
jgi:hypothetical protein